MAMRTVGGSAGGSVAVVATVSASRSIAAARRGQSSTTPNAKHATGIATRARPSTAPLPSASADPTGPASSVHSPRAKIAPSTKRQTAKRSARCPASWRPAAARDRTTTPGSGLVTFFFCGARRELDFREVLLERDEDPRRVLVAGIPRKLTPPPRATRGILQPRRVAGEDGGRPDVTRRAFGSERSDADDREEGERPGERREELGQRTQTSITTGMTAGRRLVRSLMNLPSDRRAWRRRVSKSMAPSSVASRSEASTAAFASSSRSSASGA